MPKNMQVQPIRAWTTTDGQIFPEKETAEKIQGQINIRQAHKSFGKISFDDFIAALDLHSDAIAKHIKVVQGSKKK